MHEDCREGNVHLALSPLIDICTDHATESNLQPVRKESRVAPALSRTEQRVGTWTHPDQNCRYISLLEATTKKHPPGYQEE